MEGEGLKWVRLCPSTSPAVTKRASDGARFQQRPECPIHCPTTMSLPRCLGTLITSLTRTTVHVVSPRPPGLRHAGNRRGQ